MAKNDDLVNKILDLQGKVNGNLLPEYEKAQKAYENAQKELLAIEKLAVQTSATYNKMAALKVQVPVLEADEKLKRPAAQQQQKVQNSLQGLMDTLAANTRNMSAGTQQTYDSLKTAAFAGTDPQAQEDFKKFVGNLTTVGPKDIHKDLRQWVQTQIKAGVKVTATAFADQQSKLAEGAAMTPDENPQLKRDYEDASARGLRRGWNNFKAHITSGEGVALGYAALNLGQGAVGVADIYQNGRRYTQEAQERAYLGLAPGVGAIAGTIAGSFAGNPYAGGLIGGGIGTAAEGFFGAQSEKHESLRLASETIALQMGRGTAAATKFADMIDKTADQMRVPAAELAKSSVGIASSVTGFGAGGVGLQARLARGLGDNYTDFVGTQQQAAALPFSRSYREMMAGSVAPDANAFGDAAFYYAFTGDQDNMKKQMALKNVISPSKDYQQYVADQQAAKPMGWWEATKQAGLSVLEGAPTAAIIDQRSAKRRVGDYETNNPKKIAATQKALQTDNDFYTNVYEDSRTGRETALYGQTLAGVPYRQMQQAEAAGQGLAGLKRYSGAELTDLQTAYGGVSAQEQILQKRLAEKGLTPDRQKMLKYLLASTQGQALDIQGQAQDVRVGLFRQTLSEQGARFGGGLSRSEIFGQELSLGGANAFDSRVGANVRDRQGRLRSQAAYDDALAADKTNFLSPEEREQRSTSAAQERLATRQAANQYAVERVGDTFAGSGLRQSKDRIAVAKNQQAGDITGTLKAQNALVGEQIRLQGELRARLAEGNLTYTQRTQIQTQLNDLTAQTVTSQRQAVDAAVQGFQGRYEAVSSTAYSQRERGVLLRGTSDETRAQGAAGYEASLHSVALARYQMLDPTLSPDKRMVYQARYEQMKNDAEQRGIDADSTVQMSPVFEMARTKAEHRLSRQMRSAFEPGNVMQSESGLAKMDTQELTQIEQQMKWVRGRQNLSPEEKNARLLGLTNQQEDVRNDMFERQQSVDVGWVDRLVSMSVNAPSFAARLMPGSDRVASLAERKGLGKMSARVFGYSDPNSYRDAETMGVLPSEVGPMAFGHRPGDFPSADGPDAAVTGGKGLTLDSIDSGGAGAGIDAGTFGQLNSTLAALNTLIGKGITVTVQQINPTTGQVAATTQNGQGINGAGNIMRGGGGNPASAGPRY